MKQYIYRKNIAWLYYMCTIIAFAFTGIVFGESSVTNIVATKMQLDRGICVTAMCNCNDSGYPYINYKIVFCSPETNINIVIPWEIKSKEIIYFMASNSCIGPMELFHDSGNRLKSIKPEMNEIQSYPDSYDMNIVEKLMKPESKNSFAVFRPFSKITNDYEVFLPRYYNFETSGNYTLVTQPKIYKRLKTNTNACIRIDLDPVVVKFKWKPFSQ